MHSSHWMLAGASGSGLQSPAQVSLFRCELHQFVESRADAEQDGGWV